MEFDPFVVFTIFGTVNLNEKKESEKQFSSVISHIGKTKQQAKEECLPFEWTLWCIIGQTELHFFSPRNMEQIQSYHLMKSFRCRWFPVSLSSTTGIMNEKMKHKLPRTKTLHLSHLECYMYRWVARSLLTMATRIEQLSHHKIMVLDLQCFTTWTVHLGHCSLPRISLALVVVDKWYWNFSSARMNHCIWVLPRITGFSIHMVSTPVALSIYSTKTFENLETASKKILEIPGAKLNGKKTSG